MLWRRVLCRRVLCRRLLCRRVLCRRVQWRVGRVRSNDAPIADPNLMGLVAELLDSGVTQTIGPPRHLSSARRVTAAEQQNLLIRPGRTPPAATDDEGGVLR